MSDYLSPENLTPAQLSRKLLEKHKRILNDYQREFKIRQKFSVLNEKEDLLKHWIKSASENGSNDYEKYRRDREIVHQELSSLISELQDITPKGATDEPKKRYSFLEERINAHKEAIDYWDGRIKGLSKKRKNKTKSRKKTS